MLKILVIIVIFGTIFAWEAPQLVRRKEMKELVVFSVLMFIGLAFSILTMIQQFF